jgi:hypothetical protein
LFVYRNKTAERIKQLRSQKAANNFSHSWTTKKGRGGYPSSPTASYTYIKPLQFILFW